GASRTGWPTSPARCGRPRNATARRCSPSSRHLPPSSRPMLPRASTVSARAAPMTASSKNGLPRSPSRPRPATTAGPASSNGAARARPPCRSVEERQANLSRKLTRATTLLRTWVDVEVERQNRDLLASMNNRARLQLRLQQTVEGLSVAAVSYYVVGLIGYLA